MAKKDENYLSALSKVTPSDSGSSGSAQASSPVIHTGSDVNVSSESSDSYDLLRKQNFKALYDKQIQLSSAKQNAMKQTQSQMAASGFAGTGLGALGGSAINSQYLTALTSAGNSYQDQNTTIATQEAADASTKSSSDFSALTTLMSNATDTDSLNNLLTSSYKYGSVDSNGNFVWDDSALKSAGYSDSDINQLKATYSLLNNGLSNNEFVSNNTYGTAYSDYGTAVNSIKTGAGTSASDDKWGVKNELKTLFADQSLSKEGTLVKLQNNSNGSNTQNDNVYMVFHNGKWYQTTASYYASKGGKIKIQDTTISGQ
jgi:hypothetical protein